MFFPTERKNSMLFGHILKCCDMWKMFRSYLFTQHLIIFKRSMPLNDGIMGMVIKCKWHNFDKTFHLMPISMEFYADNILI